MDAPVDDENAMHRRLLFRDGRCRTLRLRGFPGRRQQPVFQTVIRDNVSLAEAPIKGKDIFEYSRNSNGAKDYMALAQEVLKLK